MVELLKFIISKLTGSSEFDVEETQDERGTLFVVHAKPEIIGLIIGAHGKTIKNIRRIASIKAVLENKSLYISVAERV